MMCLQEGVKMERKNLARSTLYLALYTKFTKKRILQWSKVCAARPRIGDKSLRKSLLCLAKFLTCEKIFYYEQSASICVNQS